METRGGARSRLGRPIQGFATARPEGSNGGLIIIGGSGGWYPWYGAGWGWGSGYYGYYNPWQYNNTRWVFGRYGLWYDPFDPWGYYDPFYGYGYYGPGYSTPGYYGGSSSTSSSERSSNNNTDATGSVRLKAKPANAKVYVDGTLMGLVDDFDGLSSHLDLTRGTHQIELRAEGYQTIGVPVTVEVGKTTTTRITMKKAGK